MNKSILIISLSLISLNVFAIEPYTGIICINDTKSTKLEFLFKDKGDGLTKVFKRVDQQFIEVGEVVGEKPGSFSLWEDKNAYKGIDFAWHLDKVTGILKPFVLSTSLRQIDINTDTLSCRAESFWY